MTLEHVFDEVETRTAKDAADLFEQKQVPEVRRKYDGKWIIESNVVTNSIGMDFRKS